MIPIEEHPQRRSLTNELHARPFQPMRGPGRALLLAVKQPENAADRDPEVDRAHLIDLLERHGAAHPPPDASQHSAQLGRVVLKWECHTEFVSYMLYEENEAERLFDGGLIRHFPQDWLETAPGKVLAAIQCEILPADDEDAAMSVLRGPLAREFEPESLAGGWVADRGVLALGDFRIHEGGFSRFALIVRGQMGPRRVGRVCQRLLEIEVYRTLAMLALPIARRTAKRLNEIERDLSGLIGQVALDEEQAPEGMILARLTELSAEIEALAADAAFRFGAGTAYEAIVHQRIAMLGEVRVEGRQQFREFMLRRFDPAMRTVHAAERRLSELAVRASRVSELLRTRVNVALEAQNRDLLESMDRRSDLQLRLQQTVEGLSVVAISYYAVSLAGYVLAPFAAQIGIEKDTATAIATVPVVLGVWWFVRRIRRRIERGRPD